jgi:hypothetical protein
MQKINDLVVELVQENGVEMHNALVNEGGVAYVASKFPLREGKIRQVETNHGLSKKLGSLLWYLDKFHPAEIHYFVDLYSQTWDARQTAASILIVKKLHERKLQGRGRNANNRTLEAFVTSQILGSRCLVKPFTRDFFEKAVIIPQFNNEIAHNSFGEMPVYFVHFNYDLSHEKGASAVEHPRAQIYVSTKNGAKLVKTLPLEIEPRRLGELAIASKGPTQSGKNQRVTFEGDIVYRGVIEDEGSVNMKFLNVKDDQIDPKRINTMVYTPGRNKWIFAVGADGGFLYENCQGRTEKNQITTNL